MEVGLSLLFRSSLPAKEGRGDRIYVRLGNNHAHECLCDGGRQQYRAIPGEQVTTFLLPEGTGLQEALATVLAALPGHMEPGHTPEWVESDSESLKRLLDAHFELGSSRRPVTWGIARLGRRSNVTSFTTTKRVRA